MARSKNWLKMQCEAADELEDLFKRLTAACNAYVDQGTELARQGGGQARAHRDLRAWLIKNIGRWPNTFQPGLSQGSACEASLRQLAEAAQARVIGDQRRKDQRTAARGRVPPPTPSVEDRIAALEAATSKTL